MSLQIELKPGTEVFNSEVRHVPKSLLQGQQPTTKKPWRKHQGIKGEITLKVREKGIDAANVMQDMLEVD